MASTVGGGGYRGPERRKGVDRRKQGDRREMIRFEPGKSDRRSGNDRRKDSWTDRTSRH
jgi:hypothetical protein